MKLYWLHQLVQIATLLRRIWLCVLLFAVAVIACGCATGHISAREGLWHSYDILLQGIRVSLIVFKERLVHVWGNDHSFYLTLYIFLTIFLKQL